MLREDKIFEYFEGSSVPLRKPPGEGEGNRCFLTRFMKALSREDGVVKLSLSYSWDLSWGRGTWGVGEHRALLYLDGSGKLITQPALLDLSLEEGCR